MGDNILCGLCWWVSHRFRNLDDHGLEILSGRLSFLRSLLRRLFHDMDGRGIEVKSRG
jgi:hypothetical protein